MMYMKIAIFKTGDLKMKDEVTQRMTLACMFQMFEIILITSFPASRNHTKRCDKPDSTKQQKGN